MEIEFLQNLELSEDDFKIIFDGLEHLQKKDDVGDIFSTLIFGMIDDPHKKAFCF